MSGEELGLQDVLVALEDQIAEIDGEPRVEVDVDGRRHTVELRPIYPFERDILDRLIEPRADSAVTGGAVPVKGEWIYGWLNVQGEDYINNIWKNYQFFLKYVEARTSRMGNISTHSRSPGTYDSMYRYLLLLEELELLERHRRQAMSEDEYDFPVPEEFRTRTYIQLTSDFESNRDQWRNPYEALYPEGGETPPTEDEEEEPGGTDIPIEPMGPEDGGGGGGGSRELPEEIQDMMGKSGVGEQDETDEGEEQPDGAEEGTEEQPTGPSGASGLDEFTGKGESDEPEEVEDDFTMPDEEASITDFPQKQGIVKLAESSFSEAMERTFLESPIPTPSVEPEDFTMGQIAVYGTWAVGEASPGQTPLELVVSIDDTSAQMSPGFVPAGIQEHLGDVMRENNPYQDIFPNYYVVSAYNSAFMRTVDEVVRREQSELVYYDLEEEQMSEL